MKYKKTKSERKTDTDLPPGAEELLEAGIVPKVVGYANGHPLYGLKYEDVARLEAHRKKKGKRTSQWVKGIDEVPL